MVHMHEGGRGGEALWETEAPPPTCSTSPSLGLSFLNYNRDLAYLKGRGMWQGRYERDCINSLMLCNKDHSYL